MAKMEVRSTSRCSLVISINSYSEHFGNYVTQRDASNMKNGGGDTCLAAFTAQGDYPIRLGDASGLIPSWMLKTARHF